MSNDDYEQLLPEGVSCTPSPWSGGGSFYRPGEVLAEPASVGLILQHLDMLGGDLISNEPQDNSDLSLLRVELDVPSLVGHLRTVAHEPPPAVWPHHVFHHLSHMRFFSRLPPRPANPPATSGGSAGDGITVVVIDSGAWDHPWFDHRVTIAAADVEEADENGNGALDLAAGHGTFVAGVVLQHAPAAKVIARRIPDRLPDDRGRTGLVDDLTLAVMFDEVGDDVDVVNVSLGGTTVGDLAPPATAAALRRLRERNPGCVVVAAAGNTPRDRPIWPAAFKGVIAVGALDGNAPWAESARGWWIDAWADGLDARSTFFEWSGPMEHPDGANQTFPGGALWTGTSFAAPRVAGAIAAATPAPGEARRTASQLLDASPSLLGEAGVVLTTPEYGS